jgi:EpsI family protein
MIQNPTKNRIIQGILVLVSILAMSLYFKTATQQDTINISAFPKIIDVWTSEDLPISKEDLSILETKNAFVRKYTNTVDGAEVYLFLVYSQHNRKVAHPPEICYLGGGVSITENIHDPIPVEYKNLTIPTNRLKLLRKNMQHIAFYWFKVGDRFTSNYWEQQGLIALSSITGTSKGSALIRISANIADDDQNKAIRNIKSFVNRISPSLFEYLP